VQEANRLGQETSATPRQHPDTEHVRWDLCKALHRGPQKLECTIPFNAWLRLTNGTTGRFRMPHFGPAVFKIAQLPHHNLTQRAPPSCELDRSRDGALRVPERLHVVAPLRVTWYDAAGVFAPRDKTGGRSCGL